MLTAQEKYVPALIEVKVPAGGLDSPKVSSPQQLTVPVTVNAHEWR